MNPALNLSRNNAWVITCEQWARENTYIVLPVNPSDFTVTLPIKRTMEPYRSTRIMYVTRESGFKSVFGSVVLSFDISSGNALPVFRDEYVDGCFWASKALALSDNDGTAKSMRKEIDSRFSSLLPGFGQHAPTATGSYFGFGSGGEPSTHARNRPETYFNDIPIGIQNVYALHALIDERRIRAQEYQNGNPVGHQDNRVVISVNTLAFPRLLLYGWFGMDGLNTTESVDSFGEVQCSFQFHVTDTKPRLSFNSFQQLMSTYKTGIVSEESTLDWTRAMTGLAQQRNRVPVNPAKARDSRIMTQSDTAMA